MVQEHQCQGFMCVYSTSVSLVPPSLPKKNTEKNSLKALDTLVPSGEYNQDCWNSHKENRDETTRSEGSVPVLLVWGFFVLFWGKGVRGFVRVYSLGLGVGFFCFVWMGFFFQMIASSYIARREVKLCSHEQRGLMPGTCTSVIQGTGAPAAHMLAASTWAQPLHGPEETITEAYRLHGREGDSRFRHRRESIKGGVRNDARVTSSRQKALLAAPGKSEALKAAGWKGKTCYGHPDTKNQTCVKEHQRSQTSLKFRLRTGQELSLCPGLSESKDTLISGMGILTSWECLRTKESVSVLG